MGRKKKSSSDLRGVAVEVEPRSPYLGEIEHFSQCIVDDTAVRINSGPEGRKLSRYGTW